MARWIKIRQCLTREAVLVERTALESAGFLAWCPDEIVYGMLPHIEGTSLGGYRLFVLDTQAAAARDVLAQRNEAETSYPCPKCGRKTRRLRNVTGTLLLSIFFFWGGPAPARLLRRRRICNVDRTRFTPEAMAPFTDEELGYPAPPLGLMDQFRAFLAWGRSIGYDRTDSDDRSDMP